MVNANGREVGYQTESWAIGAGTVGSVNFLTSTFEKAFIGSAGDGRL